MVAHEDFRDVAHEVVEPVVDACENVYGLPRVPEPETDAGPVLVSEDGQVAPYEHVYVLEGPEHVAVV